MNPADLWVCVHACLVFVLGYSFPMPWSAPAASSGLRSLMGPRSLTVLSNHTPWEATRLCKWKWRRKSLSCVQLFATPGTIQSMEFSRAEYWSGSPFPSPGDLPNPRIGGAFVTIWATREAHIDFDLRALLCHLLPCWLWACFFIFWSHRAFICELGKQNPHCLVLVRFKQDIL